MKKDRSKINKKVIATKLETISSLLGSVAQPEAKSSIISMINMVESLIHENEILHQTIQELKDEIYRLKGEQGTPNVRPQTKPNDENHSSEEDRRIQIIKFRLKNRSIIKHCFVKSQLIVN